MVKFKVLGSATEKIGAKELEIKQTTPARIIDLITANSLNEDRWIVLVNGKSRNLKAKVSGDDEVVILPKISGG